MLFEESRIEKVFKSKTEFLKSSISIRWEREKICRNEIFPLWKNILSNTWNGFKGAELSLKIHLTKFPV